MPDNVLELPVNKIEDQSSGADRLREVLFDGVKTGVQARLSEPTELLTNAGIAFGGGAALRMMLNAGGKWGQAGKVVAAGFTLMAAADITRRAIPTVSALADSYRSDANLSENKTTVANYLGTALIDYPTMTLAGMGGFKAAGNIGARPSLVDFNLSPSSRLDNTVIKGSEAPGATNAATRALLESSLPINPNNRAAMSAAWNEAGLKNINPRQILGEMKSVDGLGVRHAELFPPNQVKGFDSIKNVAPSINFNYNSFRSVEMITTRSSMFIPPFPVVPVDLTSQVEMLQHGKILDGGIKKFQIPPKAIIEKLQKGH